MDRCVLSREDLDALLAWRDEHKELVRAFPAPLKSVGILFKHNDYRIVGIRDGDKLKLQLFHGFDSLGWAELMYDRFQRRLIGKKSKLKITQESFQSVLTVYCSLMALMVYGNEDAAGAEDLAAVPNSRDPQKAEHRSAAKRSRAAKESITYILRRTNGGLQAIPRGSHAKPAGVFTVRGHYRHYKSGKIIWIAEYKKGEGKQKKKTYKVGTNLDNK